MAVNYTPAVKKSSSLNYTPVKPYTPANANYSSVQAKGPAYYAPKPQVLGANTGNNNTNTGGIGGTGAQAPVATTPDYQNLVNQNVSDQSAVIEQDYQDSIAAADLAEQNLRAEAGNAEKQTNLYAQQQQTALENQRKTSLSGLSEQEATAQTQTKSAMQQARDLARQQQQQNIAQLSALGLSSSSVMEGLAEKLGVETARRMAGLTGSLNEVVQNISKERARVNDFAAQKVTELKDNLALQIQQIQSSLLGGIKELGLKRQMAATAKAAARADLLSQARSQIFQLQQQAQQFQQDIEKWKLTQGEKLSQAQKELEAATIPQSGLSAAIQQSLGSYGEVPGFNLQPVVGKPVAKDGGLYYNPADIYGQYTPKKQTDEIVNPFQ